MSILKRFFVILFISFTAFAASSQVIHMYRCHNQVPFFWHGVWPNATGIWTNSNNTDTLHLTVIPRYHSVDLTVCRNEPFTFGGITFLPPHSPFVDTFDLSHLSTHGCDSIVTLNLQVSSDFFLTPNLIICENDLPYPWRGHIFPIGTISGVHTFNETTIHGCDSIVNLTLTVHSAFSDTVPLVICENDLPFPWRGNIIPVGTTSGTIVFPETSIHGCDSIVTLDLTVHPAFSDTVNLIVCGNDLPFTWRGNIISVGTTSGTIIFPETSIHGCDSIVTLDLTVNESPIITILNTTVCQNDSIRLVFTGVAPFDLDHTFNSTRQIITIHGMDTALAATQTGENLFVIHSLVSANGCYLFGTSDGVEINGVVWATRNLAAHGVFVENPEDFGALFQWGRRGDGHEQRNSSTTTTLSTSDVPGHGDFILPPSHTQDWRNPQNDALWNADTEPPVKTASDPCPQGWRVPTKTEFQSLINVNNVYTTVNGVDGRIFDNNNDTIFLPAAGFRGILGSLFRTGEYGAYWSSTQHSRSDFNTTYSLDFDNQGIDIPNASTRANGVSVRCVARYASSSYDTIPITVHSAFSDTIPLTICENDLPFTWRDSLFDIGTTMPGTFTFVFERQTIHGCDSVVTLNLTVHQSFLTELSDTIFQYEAYNRFGFNLPAQNIAGETTHQRDLLTVHGCDSIVRLELFVIPPLIVEFDPTPMALCENDINFTLSYTMLSGHPQYQSVYFADRERAAGFNNIPMEAINTHNTHSVNIPLPVGGARPDTYRGTLILKNDFEEREFDFEFSVRYSSSIIIQMWNDVLALSNRVSIEENCRLSNFQWYKNGEPIWNATASSLYVGPHEILDFNAEYKVRFVRCGESVVYTCPKIPELLLDRIEFPSLVNVNQSFNISMPVSGYVEIHDLTGRKIFRQAVVEGANGITAPHFAGSYVLSIYSKTGENILKQQIIAR